MRRYSIRVRRKRSPGSIARALFAAAYVALQAGLVLSSPLRPDGVFSFQMFNESSTIAIRLSRRVATPGGEALVPTDGRWEAQSSAGGRKRHAWNDRVDDRPRNAERTSSSG